MILYQLSILYGVIMPNLQTKDLTKQTTPGIFSWPCHFLSIRRTKPYNHDRMPSSHKGDKLGPELTRLKCLKNNHHSYYRNKLAHLLHYKSKPIHIGVELKNIHTIMSIYKRDTNQKIIDKPSQSRGFPLHYHIQICQFESRK